MGKSKLELNNGKYTLGEEIASSISHGIGIIFAIVSLVIGSVMGAYTKNPYTIVSVIIFCISMLLLYTMSTLYHSMPNGIKAKKIFRILDHSMIYVLIAGTYTPFALVTIREQNTFWGWVIFSSSWIIAIIGILLNSISIEKFKKISLLLYILMGWMIIFKIDIVKAGIEIEGFKLLFYGGVIYTIGALVYVTAKVLNKKYGHSLFHVFALLGTILHTICIFKYVIQ